MLTRVISTIAKTNQKRIQRSRSRTGPSYQVSSRKNIRLPTMIMISAGSIAATRVSTRVPRDRLRAIAGGSERAEQIDYPCQDVGQAFSLTQFGPRSRSGFG